jgi:hypothetical protein
MPALHPSISQGQAKRFFGFFGWMGGARRRRLPSQGNLLSFPGTEHQAWKERLVGRWGLLFSIVKKQPCEGPQGRKKRTFALPTFLGPFFGVVSCSLPFTKTLGKGL